MIVTYEQKPEMETRMGFLPRHRRKAQVQRAMPPVCAWLQAEFSGDHSQLSGLQVEAFQSRQIDAFGVVIRVENQGFFAL